jgi:hypothetical protein
MIYWVIVIIIAAIVAMVVCSMGSAFGGLPILNYHKISSGNDADFLTVTTAQLRQHFDYLNRNGYSTIFLSELVDYVEHKKPLPAKPVMITLDDGYRDNYTSLYPVLKEYNIKANIFLVAGFIQSPDNRHVANNPMGEFMHVHEALAMSNDLVQYGLHTFSHQSYSKLSPAEIAEDVKNTRERLQQLGIPIQPCHAFTFGAYSQQNDTRKNAIFNILAQNNIRLAFRVGNRVDKLPLRNPNFISRIHVSGLFPFWKFKVALWGFIKIFNRLEKVFK